MSMLTSVFAHYYSFKTRITTPSPYHVRSIPQAQYVPRLAFNCALPWYVRGYALLVLIDGALVHLLRPNLAQLDPTRAKPAPIPPASTSTAPAPTDAVPTEPAMELRPAWQRAASCLLVTSAGLYYFATLTLIRRSTVKRLTVLEHLARPHTKQRQHALFLQTTEDRAGGLLVPAPACRLDRRGTQPSALVFLEEERGGYVLRVPKPWRFTRSVAEAKGKVGAAAEASAGTEADVKEEVGTLDDAFVTLARYGVGSVPAPRRP